MLLFLASWQDGLKHRLPNPKKADLTQREGASKQYQPPTRPEGNLLLTSTVSFR